MRRALAGFVHVSVLIMLVVAASHVHAGEIEPRAYGNTPVGVNFLVVGYAHSEGGLATVASSPLKDTSLQMNTAVLAYVRTIDLWGKPGKVDVIVPYSDLSGHAMVGGAYKERTVSGFHDPLLRLSVNFCGAPVLTVKDFSTYRQDLLIGASLQVAAPLGQYDGDKLVNLGNNRWFFKPDLGVSKSWGDVTLEISSGLIIFTDNNRYYGGTTLHQDPVSTSQLHVIYTIGNGIWASVSGNYDYGGRTRINGVRNADLQGNSRVGVTFAMPVNRNHSIKLYANNGVDTRSGKDYDLLGIAWQYRWGGGL